MQTSTHSLHSKDMSRPELNMVHFLKRLTTVYIQCITYLLLTEQEVCMVDRGLDYRPNAVRSVHTTEVKILPYRPTKLG